MYPESFLNNLGSVVWTTCPVHLGVAVMPIASRPGKLGWQVEATLMHCSHIVAFVTEHAMPSSKHLLLAHEIRNIQVKGGVHAQV